MANLFALLCLISGGCTSASSEPQEVALKPMAKLGAAIEAGDFSLVQKLGNDKFAYVKITQGTGKAQIGKINFNKFSSSVKGCSVRAVRENGEKTPQGFAVPGGDVQVTCAEITKGCGPSMFVFMTDGPLGESAAQVEFQHSDRNRCAPDASMFTDSFVNH